MTLPTSSGARTSFSRFIGVDLGGGRGKNTAIARIEMSTEPSGEVRLAVAEAKMRLGHRGTGPDMSGDVRSDSWFRDDVLVAYLERWLDEDTVVAINAPLTLPPCIRCQLPCPTVARCTVPVVMWMRRWAPRLGGKGRTDPGKPALTPYTQRATEILLDAAGLAPREALGQGTGPLAARAAHLRRILSPSLRLHENLLEVHPRATLLRLYGEAAEGRTRQGETAAVWEARKRALEGFDPSLAYQYVWPELVVRNVHVFQAVICALTAFLWARASGDDAAEGPTNLVPGHTRGGDDAALGTAARELEQLWVDDGWIWTPAPRGR